MGKTEVRYFIEDGRLYKKYNGEEPFEVKCSVDAFLTVLASEERVGWL